MEPHGALHLCRAAGGGGGQDEIPPRRMGAPEWSWGPLASFVCFVFPPLFLFPSFFLVPKLWNPHLCRFGGSSGRRVWVSKRAFVFCQGLNWCYAKKVGIAEQQPSFVDVPPKKRRRPGRWFSLSLFLCASFQRKRILKLLLGP